MKHTSANSVIVAIATILCGAAFAGDKDHADHAMKMDKNGDGKVTAAEHAAGAKAMFATMDADKDGKVTATEMDASRSTMKKDRADAKMSHEMTSAEKIKAIDTDSDGVLTAKEHEMGSAKMHARMDADGDGMLTAQEIEKGHKAMMTTKDSE